MGAGYIIGPILIILIYIIPLVLLFDKRKKKRDRFALLCIPLLFTIIFTIVIVIDNKKTEKLFQKFPQANKITFFNRANDVRDSIIQIQRIMEKLPKRTDHGSVSYILEKYPNSHNTFSFNWSAIDNLEYLEQDNNLHNFKIGEQVKSDWTEFVSSGLYPFDTLTRIESRRFIKLIKYLDRNSLNAANLKDNIITFSYNDSLRISENIGFRTITLDTSGYFGSDFFHVMDKRNGFFLLIKK